MASIPYAARDKRANRQFPAKQLTRKDPRLAAAVSKATRGITSPMFNAKGDQLPSVDNASYFHDSMQRRGRRNADSLAVLRMFPDIELSAQILVSSILSPKDMASPELIYVAPQDLLAPELGTMALGILKKHFEESYKINSRLNDMLREPLFDKGSYPVAVIPENAVDEMINGHRQISTESLKFMVDPSTKRIRNLGILGSYEEDPRSSTPSYGLSFESHIGHVDVSQVKDADFLHYYDTHPLAKEVFKDGAFENYTKEDFVTITDNPAVLRLGALKNKLRQQQVQAIYHKKGLRSALENHDNRKDKTGPSDREVRAMLLQTQVGPQQHTATVPQQYELDRRSVGNPLIIKFPTESVIPCFVPNNPKQQLGFFIALDEEGHPIEFKEGDLMQPGLQKGGNGSIANNVMNRVKSNMTETAGFNINDQQHQRMMARMYGDLIERDLISRVKNGKSAEDVAIARNEDVYRLMLSRVMAQRHTQLLYIPVQYMTYIAFMFGEDGLGQSLLDQQAMLNTIRSVLYFSEMIGSVKNSIGRTRVSVTLDPQSPNPIKTIAHLMDDVVRSRSVNLPLGMSQPPDIMEFVQRAGYEWDFTGHPELPETKIDFQSVQTNIGKPDEGLNDRLRKASIAGFGLSPEIVDNGFNAEFATTAIANNVLLGKRVISWQDKFTPQLSNHLRQIAANTESIVSDIRELFTHNFGGINLKEDDVDGLKNLQLSDEQKKRYIISHAIHLFFDNFSVELPRPSAITQETQLKDMQNYEALIDKGLEAYITADLMNEGMVGAISEKAETLRTMYKAYFMRQWMQDKGILTELAELTTFKPHENGGQEILENKVVKGVADHARIMARLGTKGIIDLAKNAEAVNKDLKKNDVDPTIGGDASGGGGGGSYGGGGGDSFGGGGGFGDLGGFDLGGDDAIPGLDDLGGEDDQNGPTDVGPDDLPNTQVEPPEGQSGLQ